MDLVFRQHTRRRMRRRGITEEMVEAVLLNPLWMPPTSRGTRYDGMVEGRRLCVVIDEDRSVPVVITTFWFEVYDDVDEDRE